MNSKNTEKRQQEINIVLKDEKMKKILREIGNDFIRKGGTKASCLSIAAQQIWQEQFRELKELQNFTSDEKIFFDKIDKFVKHYETYLWNFYESMCDNKKNKEEFLSTIRIILKSMYVVFQIEEKVEQAKIRKFAMKYFDFNLKLPITCDIYSLSCLFTAMNFKDIGDGFPKIEQFCIGEGSINSQSDFKTFKAQYTRCNRSSPTETTLYEIYFINKFF